MNETMRIIPSAPYARMPLSLDEVRQAAGSKEKAREIGRHFEALLIQEAVKAARSAGGTGWLGEDAGEASEATAQMGEEFLAAAIAAGGGLGLATLFSHSIETMLEPSTPVETRAVSSSPASHQTGHAEKTLKES